MTNLKRVPDADAVLTKATTRAADLLGLTHSELAQVIGVSGSTVSRYASLKSRIEPASKPGELSLLLIRLFRSLDPLVGSDTEKRKAWMHSYNRALNGIPQELVLKADGLTRALAYLDGMRGPT